MARKRTKEKKIADKTKYVTLGSVSRDGYTFKAKHKVTAAHKKKIDYVHVQWRFNGGKKDLLWDHKKEPKNDGDDSIRINRKLYTPLGTYGRLISVSARAIGCVKAKDKNGRSILMNKGAWTTWQTYTFTKPSRPTMKKHVDPDKGEVYFSISSDKSTGKNEKYDVYYSINVFGKMKGKKTGSSTAEDFNTSTIDAKSYTSLAAGDSITIRCTALARGCGGYSAKSVAEHVFARPKAPKITSATLRGNKRTGYVTVSFRLNDTASHVDSVSLYRLKSQVTTKAEAAISDDWEAVEGAVDDAQVYGLQDSAADAAPVEEGMHVWYRIRSDKDNLHTYSEPYECSALYVTKSTTTAGNVKVTVTGVGDGWAKLHLVDTQKNDDCIRVSWSDNENAWESTERPSSFDVTWLKSGKADVYVRGLENGTRYWFRGQAVDTDADGNEVLGPLSDISDAQSATPSSDSGTVSITVPQNVGIGEPLEVTWAFSSDMTQKRAQVYVGDKVAASISGAGVKGKVNPKILEPYSGKGVKVKVAVQAGGMTFFSEPVEVMVADTPSCAVTSGVLTALPCRFTVTTDSPNNPSVEAYITSHGATGSGLDGDSPQFEGDCIWNGRFERPTWTGEGPYTATFEAILDNGVVFWDGSKYTVTASLHDPVTNLDSAEASATFDVSWAHQADTPTGTVEVDADELTATVTVNAPTGEDGGDGYRPGDRFDLYRVTMDGERRIASNLPFGSVVTDRFAPFGREADLRYIAVTRTADGDWSNSEDLTYELPGAALRFDWGNESIELPYNIEDSAGYEKGYEEETALDGSTIGWWDGSSRRTSSLKTDLIRLESADEEEAIGSIARYAGPVFVRTPAGAAFSANVVPNEVSRSYSTRVISVSLECSEVELSSEHMPNTRTEIVTPSWRGGAVYALGGVVYDSTGNFPMDDWMFLGYHGQTLYVNDMSALSDPEPDIQPVTYIRDGSGAEMPGWAWDGSNLRDSEGNIVELEQEAA